MDPLFNRLYGLLRWLERYTKTDMVYLAKGSFWLNAGGIAVSFFSFLLYIAFAHFLSKETYGTYQYLLSVFAIVGTFTLSGMNASVTQSVARGFEGTLRASVRMQLLWGLIPLLGACAAGVYYLFAGNTVLAIGFVIIGLLTPWINSFNTYNAFLIGKKDFRRAFLYNLALYVPYYSALIAVAYFFKSPVVLLLVNLGLNALILGYLYHRTLRVYRPNNDVDAEAFKYGKHLSVMGIFSAAAAQLDNVLAFHYLGATELAIYAFATAIPDRVANLFKNIGQAALPKFAEKTEHEVRDGIGPKLAKLTLATVGVIGVYILCAPFFFSIFFPQYHDSVPYSAVYALSIAAAAGHIATSALISQRHTRNLYVLNLGSSFLSLALQFAGVLYMGLWGLVLGKTAATLLIALASVALLLLPQHAQAPQNRRGS